MFTNRKPGKSPWLKVALKMDFLFYFFTKTMLCSQHIRCISINADRTRLWSQETASAGEFVRRAGHEEGLAGQCRRRRQGATEPPHAGGRALQPTPCGIQPCSLSASEPPPLHSRGFWGTPTRHNGKVKPPSSPPPWTRTQKLQLSVVAPSPKGFHTLALVFQKEDHFLLSQITENLHLRNMPYRLLITVVWNKAAEGRFHEPKLFRMFGDQIKEKFWSSLVREFQLFAQ